MTVLPILYGCPICNELYSTVEEAEACRDQGVEDGGWQVEDFLLIPQCSSYKSDGTAWMAFEEPAWPESKSHFYHQRRYHHWYVVVGIKGDRWKPHKKLVVVWSRTETKGGWRLKNFGWTPADGDGHYGLYRPGKVDGTTAKGCVYHLPEWDEKHSGNAYVRQKMMEAVVPSELIDSVVVQEKIKEVAAMSINSIPLL